MAACFVDASTLLIVKSAASFAESRNSGGAVEMTWTCTAAGRASPLHSGAREVAAGRPRWSGLEKALKTSVCHAAEVPLMRVAGRAAEARRRVAAASKGRLLAMLESLLRFRRARHEAYEAFRAG